ncbi:MAG: hypothetical protein IJ030_06230 [Oscillospiraceae bacterium]|nr:hypothetical protein [Oscillospiraceae bacterium]
MHETCAEKVREQISEVNANRKERAEGSYGQGLIGALLGAAIGAIALLVKAGKSVADSKFVALK